MRIVTFNIQHGRTPSGAVDADLLAAACASLDADVLALQEVDVGVPRSRLVDQADVVAGATGMSVVFGEATRVAGVGRYGIALLVRGKLADVEQVALPRRGRDEPRIAILATASLNGTELTVACTHLSVDTTESESQLQAVLESLLPRPQPAVLLGDLNRRPDELRLLEVAGLEIADTTAATWPAEDPTLRIDHVAVLGLEIETVEVLPAAPVSDHRPLAVTVRVPEQD